MEKRKQDRSTSTKHYLFIVVAMEIVRTRPYFSFSAQSGARDSEASRAARHAVHGAFEVDWQNIEKLKTYPMRSFWPMLCKPDGFERLFCCTYLLYDTIYDDLGCEMDQTYMVVQHTDTLLQDILSKCGSLEDVEEMLTVISSNYREES